MPTDLPFALCGGRRLGAEHFELGERQSTECEGAPRPQPLACTGMAALPRARHLPDYRCLIQSFSRVEACFCPAPLMLLLTPSVVLTVCAHVLLWYLRPQYSLWSQF